MGFLVKSGSFSVACIGHVAMGKGGKRLTKCVRAQVRKALGGCIVRVPPALGTTYGIPPACPIPSILHQLRFSRGLVWVYSSFEGHQAGETILKALFLTLALAVLQHPRGGGGLVCTWSRKQQYQEPSKIGWQHGECFYFKHGLLNTPCPPSPGARLRHLKTGFHNCLFTFISHQAFSHSVVGCDAGSAAAPALQPGELR